MKAKVSKRLDGIQEYYFSQKLRELELRRNAGKPIINLGIGSPDMAPDTKVIETLKSESESSAAHGYQSYKGVLKLRQAIADFYANWYGVNISAETEVLPLIGSKEGIMHICMTYIDAGDEVLIPNPGYPTYSSAVKLAGGVPVYFDLKADSDWEPDFETLSTLVTHKTKLLFMNYPHMPTGKAGSEVLFEKIVAFARKHDLLVCNDNPYSFILTDKPMSLLAVPGAIDYVLELNSLSKSHNMAGWRVGMLIGSAQHVQDVLTFKSNMDSGMFLPLQLAAAKALTQDAAWFENLNSIYKKRRDLAYQILDMLDCTYSKKQNGLFVWAKVSANYADGYALSDYVFNNSHVFITPGGIFGSNGNQYIRISLCSEEAVFKAAIKQIASAIITNLI